MSNPTSPRHGDEAPGETILLGSLCMLTRCGKATKFGTIPRHVERIFLTVNCPPRRPSSEWDPRILMAMGFRCATRTYWQY